MSEGSVTIVKAGGEEAPPDLAQLGPGDVVHTGTNGRAVVRLWSEGGQAQVEPESSVQFGDSGDSEQEPPQLRLRLGNVWTYSDHPALEVFTPLASLTASQGAVYRLRIVLDATTTVYVHEGTAWMTPLIEADRSQVVLGSGERARIEPSGRIRADVSSDVGGWLGIL